LFAINIPIYIQMRGIYSWPRTICYLCQ
jgi:hypothetical protein